MFGFLTFLSVSLILLGTVVRRRTSNHPNNANLERIDPLRATRPDESQKIGVQFSLAKALLIVVVAFLVCGGAWVLFIRFSGELVTPQESSKFDCKEVSNAERLRLLGEAIGVHHPIYTQHPEAQQHFNQGLLFRWGFNSMEASKSFKIAHDLDPHCSMCIWGQAYARLYHLNYLPVSSGAKYPVFTDAENKATREIALLAHKIAKRNLEASPEDGVLKRELQYIKALLLGLPEGEWTTQVMLQSSLQSAARWLSLWALQPDDVDAGALAAEAIMLLNTWDYYDHNGKMTTHHSVLHADWSEILREATAAIILDHEANVTVAASDESSLKTLFDRIPLAESMKLGRMGYPHLRLGPRAAEEILLRVLSLQPSHPLATHLHIHMTESAPLGKEEMGAMKGVASADNLYELGSLEAHLLHMPSHIFLRVGKYKEGVESNVRAHHKSISQASACIASYAPEHNMEVLVSGASLGGMFDIAEKYALIIQEIPRIMPGPYVPSGFHYTSVLFVWMQFGKWSKIQVYPPPTIGSRGSSRTSGTEFSQVVWNFSQFLALFHVTVDGLPDENHEFEDRFTKLIENLDVLEKLVRNVPVVPQTHPGPSVGLYAAPYREIGQILFLMARSCLSIMQNDMVSKFYCCCITRSIGCRQTQFLHAGFSGKRFGGSSCFGRFSGVHGAPQTSSTQQAVSWLVLLHGWKPDSSICSI